MLFVDLCKKYNVKYDKYYIETDIPDEWENNNVSYEFDGNNHIWKKNNGKDYIIFDGSNYLHHIELKGDPPSVFEECVSEKGCYYT